MSLSNIPSQVVLCFMFFGLVVGCLITFVLSRVAPNLPYTVIVFLVGIALAIAIAFVDFDVLGDSVHLWSAVEPQLLLFLFLPPLLFGDAMTLNIHHVECTFASSILLAGPGSLIGTLLLGALCKAILPYNWSWDLCNTFGAILCATDPVAVVSILKQTGGAPRLTTLVVQEALYNDGAALVLFNLYFNKLLLSPTTINDPQNIIIYFVRIVFISPLLGMSFGLGTILGISIANRKFNTNDITIQVILTISCAYLSFFVAEQLVHVSGVLCCCFAGITIAWLGPALILEQKTMESVWSVLEWVGNTLIFLLAGLLIVNGSLEYHITAIDIGCIILVYILLLIIRTAMIASFFPFLKRLGSGVSFKECIFLSWAGLRGAVGTVLGLVLLQSTLHNEVVVPRSDGHRVFLLIGGVAALTLIVNGTLSKRLLIALGLIDESSREILVMQHYVRKRIHKRVRELMVHLNETLPAYDERLVAEFCKNIAVNSNQTITKEGFDFLSPFKGRGAVDVSNEGKTNFFLSAPSSPFHMRSKQRVNAKDTWKTYENGKINVVTVNSLDSLKLQLNVVEDDPLKAPDLDSAQMRRQEFEEPMTVIDLSYEEGSDHRVVSHFDGSDSKLPADVPTSTSENSLQDGGPMMEDKYQESTHSGQKSLFIRTYFNGVDTEGSGAADDTSFTNLHHQKCEHTTDVVASPDTARTPSKTVKTLLKTGDSSSHYLSSKNLKELSNKQRLTSPKHKVGSHKSNESIFDENNNNNLDKVLSPLHLEDKNVSSFDDIASVVGVVNPSLLYHIRIAFYEVLRAEYWKYIEQGKLPRNSPSALALLYSVDVGLDTCNSPGLGDWAALQPTLTLSSYTWLEYIARVLDYIINAFIYLCICIFSAFESLPETQIDESRAKDGRQNSLPRTSSIGDSTSQRSQRRKRASQLVSFFSRALSNYLETRRQELGVYILSSFIEAHKIAQVKVPHYLGEEEGVDTPELEHVVRESRHNVALAEELLENIDSEIISYNVSKQVATILLHMQQDMVEKFQEEGVLQPRDADQLLLETHKNCMQLRREWLNTFWSHDGRSNVVNATIRSNGGDLERHLTFDESPNNAPPPQGPPIDV